MPKDRFRREREHRRASAIQFKNVYRRSLRRYPLPYELERTDKSVKSGLLDKSFNCDCGQKIVATKEGQDGRQSTSCLKCGKVFKLHRDYATSKNEIYYYF